MMEREFKFNIGDKVSHKAQHYPALLVMGRCYMEMYNRTEEMYLTSSGDGRNLLISVFELGDKEPDRTTKITEDLVEKIKQAV